MRSKPPAKVDRVTRRCSLVAADDDHFRSWIAVSVGGDAIAAAWLGRPFKTRRGAVGIRTELAVAVGARNAREAVDASEPELDGAPWAGSTASASGVASKGASAP